MREQASSLVVITSASHAEGPQFDPGNWQIIRKYQFCEQCITNRGKVNLTVNRVTL